MPFSCAIAGTPTLRAEQYPARRESRRPADAHAGMAGVAGVAHHSGRVVTARRFVTAVPLSALSASGSMPAIGSFVTGPAISTVTTR